MQRVNKKEEEESQLCKLKDTSCLDAHFYQFTYKFNKILIHFNKI